MSSSSDADLRSSGRTGGFTLLELVVAITLFSFIVITVLADRERSVRMSGEARILQTVRYLAAAKIDQIRHDVEDLGERDSGDFDDLETDWQDYGDYTWEAEIEPLVVAGNAEDPEADFLYDGDEDLAAPVGPDGEPLPPRYVRRLVFTVRFAPDGEPRPGLSVRVVTYLPPAPEEEDA